MIIIGGGLNWSSAAPPIITSFINKYQRAVDDIITNLKNLRKSGVSALIYQYWVIVSERLARTIIMGRVFRAAPLLGTSLINELRSSSRF